MKALMLIISTLCIISSGCYTHRDKVAHKRAELTLKSVGATEEVPEPVRELSMAVGAECEQANIDSGAAEIPDDSVQLTVEASVANANGIAQEREARNAIFDKVTGALKWAAEKGGPWGFIGTAGIAIAGWLLKAREKAQKMQALAEKAQRTEVAGIFGRLINKLTGGKPEAIDEHLASEAKGMVNVNADDVKSAMIESEIGEI